jgi:hypothetical protein
LGLILLDHPDTLQRCTLQSIRTQVKETLAGFDRPRPANDTKSRSAAGTIWRFDF